MLLHVGFKVWGVIPGNQWTKTSEISAFGLPPKVVGLSFSRKCTGFL